MVDALVEVPSIRRWEIEEERKEVEKIEEGRWGVKEAEEEVKEDGKEMKDGEGVKEVRMRLCGYASCKRDC